MFWLDCSSPLSSCFISVAVLLTARRSAVAGRTSTCQCQDRTLDDELHPDIFQMAALNICPILIQLSRMQ